MHVLLSTKDRVCAFSAERKEDSQTNKTEMKNFYNKVITLLTLQLESSVHSVRVSLSPVRF